MAHGHAAAATATGAALAGAGHPLAGSSLEASVASALSCRAVAEASVNYNKVNHSFFLKNLMHFAIDELFSTDC